MKYAEIVMSEGDLYEVRFYSALGYAGYCLCLPDEADGLADAWESGDLEVGND